MKPRGWILAGLGVGFTAYFLFTRRSAVCSGATDSLEAAAGKTTRWGRKQRVSGAGRYAVGKLKEGIGRVAGNDDLVGEGIVDQAAGIVKDTAGKVAGSVGEAIHEGSR